MSMVRQSIIPDRHFFWVSLVTVTLMSALPGLLLADVIIKGGKGEYLDMFIQLIALWLSCYGAPASICVFKRRFFPGPPNNEEDPEGDEENENHEEYEIEPFMPVQAPLAEIEFIDEEEASG